MGSSTICQLSGSWLTSLCCHALPPLISVAKGVIYNSGSPYSLSRDYELQQSQFQDPICQQKAELRCPTSRPLAKVASVRWPSEEAQAAPCVKPVPAVNMIFSNAVSSARASSKYSPTSNFHKMLQFLLFGENGGGEIRWTAMAPNEELELCQRQEQNLAFFASSPMLEGERKSRVCHLERHVGRSAVGQEVLRVPLCFYYNILYHGIT